MVQPRDIIRNDEERRDRRELARNAGSSPIMIPFQFGAGATKWLLATPVDRRQRLVKQFEAIAGLCISLRLIHDSVFFPINLRIVENKFTMSKWHACVVEKTNLVLLLVIDIS